MSNQTDHNYPTRFKVANNISLTFLRIIQYTHSFYYRAIKAWNSSPVLLRNSNSLCVFRKRLKHFIIDSI